MRKFILIFFVIFLSLNRIVNAHCQMPCGIYHDDMVFDLIDQYVETMYKAVSELNSNQFQSVRDKKQFVRWVMTKEKESDVAADLVLKYFLQQKIKPGEEDTPKILESAHKLLFLMVGIKQNSDIEIVKQFYEEWEKFKLFFHIEGYECKMEKIKLKEWEEARKKFDEKGHHHHHEHKNQKENH